MTTSVSLPSIDNLLITVTTSLKKMLFFLQYKTCSVMHVIPIYVIVMLVITVLRLIVLMGTVNLNVIAKHALDMEIVKL